jgi:hypothetical protein
LTGGEARSLDILFSCLRIPHPHQDAPRFYRNQGFSGQPGKQTGHFLQNRRFKSAEQKLELYRMIRSAKECRRLNM